MKTKRHHITSYFYVFLCFIFPLKLIAQGNLNGYLEMAAQNNPSVKAAFSQYLASLENVPQLGSLPDPRLSFEYFIKPMELPGGKQRSNVQLMQMFPWFGTLKAGRDEAFMMARAEFEAFQVAKSELFFQVKSGWYQLMRYDREIALASENIVLLESLEKLALIKFQSAAAGESAPPQMRNPSGGKMSSSGNQMNNMNNQQTSTMASGNAAATDMMTGMNSRQPGLQDVLRIKMEILEQKNKLALLTDQRRTEEARFNALLNRDLETKVQITDSLVVNQLPIDKSMIADSILSSNPMLAMIENEIASYTFMEEKGRKMGLPMLGVGLNYMIFQENDENASVMNGRDMLMPMISVSLPVYRKKYNAMQKEARQRQEAGIQERIDLKNKLLVLYRQFMQDLDDAERRIVLYKEQEALAKTTIELLISGYTATGNDFEEVLRMQLKSLDISFKYTEAIADYNTSLAMAEMLMNSIKL